MSCRELPTWLAAIALLSSESDIIMVPGGGVFADKVRKMQTVYKFDDLTAHRMALLAMCQYGHFLAGMDPNIQIIEDICPLLSTPKNKKPFLWLPASLIYDDEIPASWDFTADSTALWLAIKLSAENLILVKAKDLPTADTLDKNSVTDTRLDKYFWEIKDRFKGQIHLLSKHQYHLLSDICCARNNV